MELLRELSDQAFGLKPRDVRYVVRRAARAVMLNNDNKIALMHATRLDYHKLPGGGIKEREKIEVGLYRELMEETGCRAKIIRPIGVIIEYRSKLKVMPFSYCFLARTVGAEGKPKFTAHENKEGFVVEWVTLAEALQILAKQRQRMTNYAGKFMTERETIILQRAASLLRT